MQKLLFAISFEKQIAQVTLYLPSEPLWSLPSTTGMWIRASPLCRPQAAGRQAGFSSQPEKKSGRNGNFCGPYPYFEFEKFGFCQQTKKNNSGSSLGRQSLCPHIFRKLSFLSFYFPPACGFFEHSIVKKQWLRKKLLNDLWFHPHFIILEIPTLLAPHTGRPRWG